MGGILPDKSAGGVHKTNWKADRTAKNNKFNAQ